MVEISRKIAQNTLLQIGGKALGTVLSLVTFDLLLKYLGVDGYGALTVALNFAAFFAALVDFGFTLVTTQMISEPNANESKLLGNIFTLRALSSFLLLGGASVLVFFFPYALDVKIAAAVSCLSFFFGSLAWMFVGVFQKRLDLTWAVLAELLNRVVVVACVYTLLAFPPSVALAASIFVAGGIVQLIVTLLAVGRHLSIKPQISWVVWKTILRRSWPIGVSTAFNLVYLRGDVLFMSILGTSDYEIGLYGGAYKIVDVLTTVPVMFMGLILPMLTLTWAQGKKAAFREHLQRAVDGLAMLGIPFAFGAIAVGGPLLGLIDDDLAAAGPVLAILGMATCAVFMNSIFGHTIVALNKQKGMILGYAFTAALSVVGYLILIPRAGALGAAWVTLVSEVLIGLLTAGVVFATSRVAIALTPSIRALGASIIMFVGLLLVPLPHVLLSISWGIVVYFAALSLFGGPSPRKIVRLFLPERALRV